MLTTFPNERMMREYARMLGYRVKESSQGTSHDATLDDSEFNINWTPVRVITPAKV